MTWAPAERDGGRRGARGLIVAPLAIAAFVAACGGPDAPSPGATQTPPAAPAPQTTRHPRVHAEPEPRATPVDPEADAGTIWDGAVAAWKAGHPIDALVAPA